MIMCINQPLTIKKEKEGRFNISIPGIFHLMGVGIDKKANPRLYFSYERGVLFVLNEDGKMLLRGEISSKECLKDSCIISTWHFYNPPYKKTFYY